MKKWLILFCLIALPVLSQEVSEDTFSENNPNLIRNDESRPFTGSAFVYIQGISDKPQPKNWMDKAKIRLFGSMEIPNGPDAPHLTDTSSILNPSTMEPGIPVKSFFGAKKEVKYVPHTSNWDFIIQLMDEKTISIQENIQFLLTDSTSIARSWPIKKDSFSLINASIDGNSIKIDPQKQSVQLNFDSLPAGLHRISLHYILSLPSKDDFILPLIGKNWPLVTDNLSGIILKGQISLEQAHFLLGENNQEIPQNFLFQSDEENNVFFKNTHILPAFTQIQLAGKSLGLTSQQKNKKIFSIPLTFTCSFLIIILYLILSACEIYFSSLTYLLKRFKHISLNPFICFLYRSGEVIIGCLSLLFLTFITTILFDLSLSYNYWIILIVLSVIGVAISDILIFYPKQKLIHNLHKNTKEEK